MIQSRSRFCRWLACLALTVLAPLAQAAPAAAASTASAAPATADAEARHLNIAGKHWTGDFDQMLARRLIRVNVPYSRSLYFIDKGRERGLSAELVRDFERWVNREYAKQLGKRPLTVYIIATTRDELLSDVASGLADIAVGNLSVTADREKVVDFVAPDAKSVNVEILVTGPGAPAINTLDGLSGQTVFVRPSSSYHASLLTLNERFKQEGKAPVKLTAVPEALEDEDMLEMVDAGLIGAIVVDDWKAKLWASVLPKLKLHEDVVLRAATPKGWAIRKDSPQLAAALNRFYTEWVRKAGVIPYRQKRYMSKIKTLYNSNADADRKRFQQTIALFKKYGDKYDFDPLMLAAQGYQESTLDQNKKSHVGAIGVMQIMPATGKGLKVGDIHQIEPNVHGGALYMDRLMTRYFKDAHFNQTNRTLFAFASYNAGPGNISKMRKEAAKRGLNPDKWFNNVEVVTAEKIGMETTTYVRNIYKYYVSYKLSEEARAEVADLKQQLVPPKK